MAFNLDDQPGSKPVMGVDDLLLGLTHHWCRDRSVFPTEDDRLDLSAIMLFQSYTACRPAELVDGTKSRGGKDPMLDDSNVENSSEDSPTGVSPNRSLRAKQSIEVQLLPPQKPPGTEMEERDISELGDRIIDDNDASDYDDTSDTDYNDEGNDEHEIADTDENDTKMNSSHISVTGTDRIEEDRELVRKHKALCYEDMVLWIVKNTKNGGRDVLAMEVFFRYHKGVDKKPKP
jgi:hypothetical protein